jgi:hypothetical protein
VPPELLEYVENGRNPDIYTREFVELVRRGNQLMRGKTRAFADFRDILAADMAAAMPELRRDVRTVCEATGGVPPPLTMTTAAVSGATATATSASASAAPAPAATAPATANATPVLSHPAPPASSANGAAGVTGGPSGAQPSGTSTPGSATAPFGNAGF